MNELKRGELELKLAELARLRDTLLQVDSMPTTLGAKDERVRLLQTIAGVGRRIAEVIAAYLDDPRRFENAQQVSSYAGLVPLGRTLWNRPARTSNHHFAA